MSISPTAHVSNRERDPIQGTGASEGKDLRTRDALLADVLLDPQVSLVLACDECCLSVDLCAGHPGRGDA